MMMATIIAIWCVLIVTLIAGWKLVREINKQEEQIEDLEIEVDMLKNQVIRIDDDCSRWERETAHLKAEMEVRGE